MNNSEEVVRTAFRNQNLVVTERPQYTAIQADTSNGRLWLGSAATTGAAWLVAHRWLEEQGYPVPPSSSMN